MSAKLLPEGNAPAYNDAERGITDIHLAGVQHAPKYPVDEKKADSTAVTLFPAPKEKESSAVAPPPSKPSTPKKKQKASVWTRWRLFFNTYRYAFESALCMIINERPSPSSFQEILHVYCHAKCHWHCARCLGALALRD